MGFWLGLVVACGVKGEAAEELSGGGVNDAYVEFVDQHDDWGSGVGSSDSDVVELSGVAQGRGSCISHDVMAGSVVIYGTG